MTSLTDFGAFVEVEKGIEGLVHISDISWEKVKHPSEKLQVGQEVETIVLNIDVDRQKVSLGIKQLEGDIWEDFFIRQKVGDVVKVKIVRLTDFGAFVEIMPGIEGVVFTAELDEKKLEKPSDAFAVGDERNAKIIKMNPKAKKISLSFKQAVYDHGEAGLPALHGIAERPDDPRRHHEGPAQGLQGSEEEGNQKGGHP